MSNFNEISAMLDDHFGITDASSSLRYLLEKTDIIVTIQYTDKLKLDEEKFALPLKVSYYEVGNDTYMLFFNNVIDLNLLRHIHRKLQRYFLTEKVISWKIEVPKGFRSHILIGTLRQRRHSYRDITTVVHRLSKERINQRMYTYAKSSPKAAFYKLLNDS